VAASNLRRSYIFSDQLEEYRLNCAKQNQNWERSDQPKRLRIADFRLWKEKQIPKSEFRIPKSLGLVAALPVLIFV
jgi:hypothetical protein